MVKNGRQQGGGSTTSDWSDPDAVIAGLYDTHARSLVTLARLFVDHRDAAEDVVQESFIRLSRSLHRIDDPAKAAAYLRSIVLNLARDHNRRGMLSLRHQSKRDEFDSVGLEEQIVERSEHRRVLAVVRRLPRRQRDCLALRYLLELSVAEIADTLGLSPNSVKTHLKRGLAALRSDADLASVGEETS